MDIQTKAQLQNYLKLFYSKRYFISSFVILVTIVAFVFLKYERKEYKSYATLLIDQSKSSTSSMNELFTANSGFQNLLENHIEHIKSFKVSKKVYEYLFDHKNEFPIIFEIFDESKTESFPTEEAKISWLMSRLEVNILNRKADIITLSFKAPKPTEAMYIANVYQKVYQAENLNFVEEELATLKNYLIKKVTEKGEQLRLSEEDIKRYKSEKGIKSIDDQTKNQIKISSDLKTDREKMQLELEGSLEAKKTIDEQIKLTQTNLENKDNSFNSKYIENISDRISNLKAQKTKLEIQLATRGVSKDTYKNELNGYDEQIKAYEKEYTEALKSTANDPIIKDPFQQQQDLRTRYLNLDSDIKSLQKKIKLIDEYLTKNGLESLNLPDAQLQLIRLERDANVYQKLYLFLNEKLEETEIKISSKKNNVKILDEAILMVAPVYPKSSLILMGSILGSLFLSIGVIFMLEYFDNTIKHEEEMDHYDLNRIGMIPKISLEDSQQKLDNIKDNSHSSESGKLIEARLVSHIDPKSMVAESYRTIRTNLKFKLKQAPEKKTFLLTSCGPQEGKSTTISNIAISFAQQGLKVILIDADLRRPILHSVFGIVRDNGFTNLIMGDITLPEAIKSTIIDNLYLIPSGIIPPNPSELLGLETVDNIIKELSSQFDLILFDTPPVIAVTDAAVLTEKVDYSILIVRANKTDRDMIKEAKKRLIQSNNLLGCILNDFDFERHYGYKYQYYNYYYGKNK